MSSKLKCLCLIGLNLVAAPAFANEPLELRESWEGRVSAFMTGVPMAYDTNSNQRADKLILPAVVNVSTSALPSDVNLVAARLYWGGTQIQNGDDCVGSDADREVQISRPDGAVRQIVADRCYCSGADAGSYDVWVCHADISADAGPDIVGQWSVSEYEGLIADGSTDTASAAFLWVYEKDTLPPRRVALYDGNYVLAEQAVTFELDVNVDTNPDGELTFFVLEGDTAGEGEEFIEVNGLPGAAGPLRLEDSINPVNNPFNRTINTTDPPREGVVGVDVDRFDITGALTAGDSKVAVTYSAGEDKVWLAVNVVGVNLFDPVLTQNSFKQWTSVDSEVALAGGMVRFEIHLENTGNETGTVTLSDEFSDAFESWVLVSNDSGTQNTAASGLELNNVVVEPGESVKIVVDAVIADVEDGTVVSNTASWTRPNEGGFAGSVSTGDIVVRRDGDSDGFYDNEDNCPDVANADQTDSDADGVGDACEDAPDIGVSDMGAPDMELSGPTTDTIVSGTGCTTPGIGSPLLALLLLFFGQGVVKARALRTRRRAL